MSSRPTIALIHRTAGVIAFLTILSFWAATVTVNNPRQASTNAIFFIALLSTGRNCPLFSAKTLNYDCVPFILDVFYFSASPIVTVFFRESEVLSLKS